MKVFTPGTKSRIQNVYPKGITLILVLMFLMVILESASWGSLHCYSRHDVNLQLLHYQIVELGKSHTHKIISLALSLGPFLKPSDLETN